MFSIKAQRLTLMSDAQLTSVVSLAILLPDVFSPMCLFLLFPFFTVKIFLPDTHSSSIVYLREPTSSGRLVSVAMTLSTFCEGRFSKSQVLLHTLYPHPYVAMLVLCYANSLAFAKK